MAGSELSYEARVVHYMAKQGVEIDYYTDSKVDYGQEAYEQPPTLRNFVFAKGQESLRRTPRTLTGTDVKTMRENGPYDLILGTATTAIDMGVFLREFLDVPLAIQWLDVPTWRIVPWGPSQIYRESLIPLPLLPQEMFDAYRAEWGYWFSNIPNIDAIIALTFVTKRHIIQFYGENLDNIFVTYHGSIDKDAFDQMMNPNLKREHQIFHGSRLDFHKGVDKFIHIAHLVQKMMKDNLPKVVIMSSGNYDWYEKILKDYASRILKDYAFTGWVSNREKIRLLQESKVIASCNWDDDTTCGVVVGEALYCGCPAVVWDLPQNREVYKEHAFYVPKNDYEGMARTIVDLLTESLEWDAEAAKEFMINYRSIESHGKGILKILSTIQKP